MSNTGFITAVYFAVKNAAVVATVVEILINVVVEGVIECCFRRQSFKAHFVNSLSVVAIVAVTVVYFSTCYFSKLPHFFTCITMSYTFNKPKAN